MNTKKILLTGAILIATAAVQGKENIVLPTESGGFVHRGTTTGSQTHVISVPDQFLANSYHSDSGLQEFPVRLETPLMVPKFDDSLGTLVAINVTLDAFIETEIVVEAEGILDPQFTHEAGFFTNDTLFGNSRGYPVVGLLQRPSQDPRGIAPNFYPIGSVDVSCMGFPGDEDSCFEFDVFDAPTGTTVNVFIFVDQDGPIYTLEDWVGQGFVPAFTIFIDNPVNSDIAEQFGFFVDNVDAAWGYVDTSAYGASVTVEYVYEIDLPDTDGDGVVDDLDNCTLASNPDQTDTNGDNYGNACDADLNNDGVVNASDLGLFRTAFFSVGVTDSDFNADGITNALDLGVLRDSFFGAPGPSGLAP